MLYFRLRWTRTKWGWKKVVDKLVVGGVISISTSSILNVFLQFCILFHRKGKRFVSSTHEMTVLQCTAFFFKELEIWKGRKFCSRMFYLRNPAYTTICKSFVEYSNILQKLIQWYWYVPTWMKLKRCFEAKLIRKPCMYEQAQNLNDIFW